MLQAEQWKELLDLCEKARGLYTRIHSFIKSCSTEDCSPATYISTPSDGPFLENSIERERICKELRAWKAATEGLLTLLSQDSASLASPPKESHQPHPAQRKDASLNPRNERLQKRPNSVVYPRPSKRSRPASSPRSPNPPKSADSQPSKPLKPTISLRPRKPLKPPPESVVSPRPPEPPKSVGSSQTPERSEPLPSLRYGCCLSDLGENMVSTIEKAREKLGSDLVEEHGYLILKLDTPLDMSDLPRLGRVSEQGTIKGFEFETSKNGAVQVRSIANPEFVEIDIPHFPEPIPASNPEEEFQNWVDNPPKTPMEYYVGDPLVDHFVNSLLHPGTKMLEAPKILGYNTLYWYLSKHAGTPAPLHKEDVERGSANALIGGAEKHWIFIYRRCAGKLLEEIRKQFKHTRCSQFVRHLNIILSPGWLKAKGIKFDIVCQRPGEILCTLPGKSYHQGRNTGANLAVAINYQFDNAPNLPSNYAWCKPGPCGSNPLTADQLGIPRIKPLCNRNMHTDFCGGDEKYFVTPLPEEVVDTSQEVQNLIQFCMNSNLPPSMLQCRDQSDLRKRLNTFLPGKSIDGTVLQILLKLIASPLRFTVIESPELDVISPTSIDHWLKEQKLVFPFHIKEGDRKDRNHWAVGVLDREGSSFTTLGLSEPLAKKWTAQLCSPKEELMNKQKSLGKNSDPALCALRCCFALERHFGSYPESLPRPKCLRKHYLRKLLMSIQQTSAISELSHEGITFNLGVIQKNVPFQTLLRAALQDTSFSIVQEKRARVIQMILQCSKASLASRPDSLEGCELSNLFRQLKRIDKTKSELVHHERVLCLKLLQKFVERVEAEGERQRRPRLKRKAEKQRGYVDGTPPEKSPNRVVIHQITPDSALQTDLRAYLERGKILSYLTSNLGSGLLKMLPTSSSYSPNFGSQCLENLLQEQIHQYPNLLEPIEPLGYDRLTWDEMSFFIKWFSFLLPAFAPPPPPPGSRSPLRVVILDESY